MTPENVQVSLSLLGWLVAAAFALASSVVGSTLWIVSRIGKVDDKVAELDRKFVGHSAKTNQRLEEHDRKFDRLAERDELRLQRVKA